MRRGHNGGLAHLPGGKLLGVFLGTDHCAEHEWGISRLEKLFGITIKKDDRSVLGVERRKITKVPDTLVVFEDPKPLLTKARQGFLAGQAVLFCDRIYGEPHLDEVMTPIYGSKLGVQGAWDEASFAFAADKEIITEMKAAFDALDIMMMVGSSGNPFGGGPGLSFSIYSRIPQEIKDMQKAVDEERFWLKDWEDATGVREKIHASKKISRGPIMYGGDNLGAAYHALSAKKHRDGNVMWWLNPYNQYENAFGWYTTEELEQWCEGRGPVIENSRAAKGGPRT